AGVDVTINASASHYTQAGRTNESGQFEFPGGPVGEYRVIVRHPGFTDTEQPGVVGSGAAPVLHLQLKLAEQKESVEVAERAEVLNPQSSTPTTLVTREQIGRTPGADLSNSLAMITNFVPGAYMTHDQLHVRGGHQVTWAIDGIPIPNTNI